jgi:V/A-type H+-transporting ATPase subunit E
MSAEKIIQQINKDAESEVKKILRDAEQQARHIIENARNEAQQEAERILAMGKIQSENIKQIHISKAYQEARREASNVKEHIIDECFTLAFQRLSEIPDDRYNTIITQLMREGKKKLGSSCGVVISGERDREMAKMEKVPVKGIIATSGGVILQSEDGKIAIDNTFEGILKRKRNTIRIEVGQLLFS